MHYLLLSLPVIVPILLWAGYHYYKDRHQPEPLLNLLACFVAGVGAFFVGKLGYLALDQVGLRFDAYELAVTNLWQLFLYAVLVIGGIEETAKLLPFVMIALRLAAFDEPVDGIIYASFIALGFAAAENIYYLQFLSFEETLYRGFAGPLVHVVFASVWGFYIGRQFLAGRPLLRAAFIAITAAALLHGVYDFLVIAYPLTALPFAAVLIALVWVWRLWLIRHLTLADGQRQSDASCS